MNENSFELHADSLDNLPLEELQEKLKLAKDKLNELIVRENNSEFYDKELKDSFMDAIGRFGKNKELLSVYLDSIGVDYDEATENYNRYVDFMNNELGLAKKDVSQVSTAIARIERAQIERSRQQVENEEKEKFSKEKKDLADTLYEMLNEIYEQIPKEARDVGMDEKAALKKYLPQLTLKADTLEGCIERIEGTQLPFQLAAIKRELEGWQLLEK